MELAELTTWTVVLPLAAPLQLGSVLISEREYIVVTARFTDGTTGVAWSMTRGLALADCLHDLTSRILGEEIEPEQVPQRLTWASDRPEESRRSLSLLEIACWDARAKARAMPLYELLGGTRAEVPAIPVAGYPGPGRSPEAAGEALAHVLGQGHPVAKMARWPDATDTRRVIDRAAREHDLSHRIVVDCAWAFADLDQAASEVASWGQVPLRWVEDPVRAETALAQPARRRFRDPVAIGDEVSDPRLLEALASSGQVDIVRLDATVCGGIGAAMGLAETCRAMGVPVSTHVHMPLHVHIAASTENSLGVEYFAASDAEYDPIDAIFATRPLPKNGRVRPLEVPGIGVEFDWEFIHHHLRAHRRSHAEARADGPRIA